MSQTTQAEAAPARPGRAPAANPAAIPVSHVFGRIVATGTDISMRQAAVLAQVVGAPGACTVRALAKSLNVVKPAVTRAIDRLEELEMARRKPDPSDRRSVLVDPTEKGIAWIGAVAATLKEI